MNKTLMGYIFFIITAIIFGSNEVASKIALTGSGVDATHVNLAKFGIAALILLPFMLNNFKQDNLTFKDHLHFAELGILVSISLLALVESISVLGSAALASLIFSANPIFTVIFGHTIAKEKGGKYLWHAVILGIVGIATISAHKIIGVKHVDWWGLTLVLFAAIIFSLYSVLSKMKNHEVSKYTNIFFTFVWATITYLIVMLLRKEPIIVPAMYTNTKVLLALLWIGIVITGIGYILYFKGMELAGVHRSTTVFFLKPVVAGTLAWLILGEHITWNMILGTVLVILSMYLLYKD
ncbi:MAG: EamA family transporter [Dictyoglomi bacterium]|nr:EamA family transporter [Dictyoglomota bacterium]